MYFSPSYNTITIDGVDQTSVTPEGIIYPLELTPDNIDPNNLITLYITDTYPWEITVYADSTKLVTGTMNPSGLLYLWPPDVQGGGGITDGGTNTETQYSMYIDTQYGQEVIIDGIDQSSTWSPGFIYPVLLTTGSIDPQNLVTFNISDPYPWSITVYADSTNLTVGDIYSDGNYQPLWPPDVQGGGGK